MRTYTFHGVAPAPNPGRRPKVAPTYSNRGGPQAPPDPVFLLKPKVRSAAADHARGFPHPGQHVVFAGPSVVEQRWPFDGEFHREELREEVGHEEVFDDLVFEGAFHPPLTQRQKAVRAMAVVAYGMLFLVAATIFTESDAL